MAAGSLGPARQTSSAADRVEKPGVLRAAGCPQEAADHHLDRRPPGCRGSCQRRVAPRRQPKAGEARRRTAVATAPTSASWRTSRRTGAGAFRGASHLSFSLAAAFTGSADERATQAGRSWTMRGGTASLRAAMSEVSSRNRPGTAAAEVRRSFGIPAPPQATAECGSPAFRRWCSAWRGCR